MTDLFKLILEVQILPWKHRNRCTDLRHPELLATSLLKCPRQDCCETPPETKKIGKLSPLSSFIFLTLRDLAPGHRGVPVGPRAAISHSGSRLIGSIRRECLDHMIVFGEAHLRRILRGYAAY
jgi:hypothetical protein